MDECKVLIIEDNMSDAWLAREAARGIPDVSVDVEHVNRLANGLQRLREGPLDVVLLDLGLPDSQGIDALKVILEAHPDLPIVVLTGSDDEALGVSAIKHGAAEYLPKRELTSSSMYRALLYAQERARTRAVERKIERADRWSALGKLSAGMAHEINNPAAFLQLNLEMMNEELEALAEEPGAGGPDHRGRLREVRELGQECLEGLRRICSIVDDLNSLGRIRSSEVEWVDLREVAEQAIRFVGREIQARASLETRLENVPWVAGHRDRLIQVVVNLLMNAAQAIDQEASVSNMIKVSVELRGEGVLVVVEDDGVGIPAELKRRIFEPFYTTRFDEGGTGLGLSVSLTTVEQHGGQIHVGSKSEPGTRIEVTLPLVTPFQSVAPKRHGAPGPEARGASILVIEDEPLLRRALQRRLEQNHDVVIAADPHEGLRIWSNQSDGFDLILCDVMMPVLDGVDVYRRSLELGLPVKERLVFITGGAFTPKVSDFLATENPKVLRKPINFDELTSVIKDRCASVTSV